MPATKPKPPVIVTGSTGLIGSQVCERLAKSYSVVGLDIESPPSSNEKSQTQWIRCDFTEDSSVRDAVSAIREQYGGHLASVVHLAAYYDFAGEPSPLYQELTVEGTRRLLRALRTLDSVEQFVFSSSLLVMKPCEPGEKLTEQSPTQAEWEYPQSKLDAEEVIRSEHGAIPAVILRIAGVYDEEGHSLPICQNIRRIAEKELESYLFPGDAERGQAFVHVDDVVSSVECAIAKRHELNPLETLLIAEDECLSYEKLQDEIGELVHGVEDWPTIRIPKLVAKTGAWVKEQLAGDDEDAPFIKPWMVDLADAHYPVDNSQARARLGWRPTHRLSETLPKMIENLRRDPRQWYERNGLPWPTNGDLPRELASPSSSSKQ